MAVWMAARLFGRPGNRPTRESYRDEMANPCGKRLQANPMYQTAFMRLYGEQILISPKSADATPPRTLAFGNALQALKKTEALPVTTANTIVSKGEYELTVLEDLWSDAVFLPTITSIVPVAITLYPEDTERALQNPPVPKYRRATQS